MSLDQPASSVLASTNEVLVVRLRAGGGDYAFDQRSVKAVVDAAGAAPTTADDAPIVGWLNNHPDLGDVPVFRLTEALENLGPGGSTWAKTDRRRSRLGTTTGALRPRPMVGAVVVVETVGRTWGVLVDRAEASRKVAPQCLHPLPPALGVASQGPLRAVAVVPPDEADRPTAADDRRSDEADLFLLLNPEALAAWADPVSPDAFSVPQLPSRPTKLGSAAPEVGDAPDVGGDDATPFTSRRRPTVLQQMVSFSIEETTVVEGRPVRLLLPVGQIVETTAKPRWRSVAGSRNDVLGVAAWRLWPVAVVDLARRLFGGATPSVDLPRLLVARSNANALVAFPTSADVRHHRAAPACRPIDVPASLPATLILGAFLAEDAVYLVPDLAALAAGR
ncbi:MAG: chemotaxis protein CheW [Planctomycetia bacterium]